MSSRIMTEGGIYGSSLYLTLKGCPLFASQRHGEVVAAILTAETIQLNLKGFWLVRESDLAFCFLAI